VRYRGAGRVRCARPPPHRRRRSRCRHRSRARLHRAIWRRRRRRAAARRDSRGRRPSPCRTSTGAALVDAMPGGKDDAQVGGVDGGARAAAEALAVGQNDEDRPVLPEGGRRRVGDGCEVGGRHADFGWDARGPSQCPSPLFRHVDWPRLPHARRRPEAQRLERRCRRGDCAQGGRPLCRRGHDERGKAGEEEDQRRVEGLPRRTHAVRPAPDEPPSALILREPPARS
jgi:hypothetical protein